MRSLHKVTTDDQFEAIWDLLACSVANPDQHTRIQLCEAYLRHPAYQLWAIVDGEFYVGVIGVRLDIPSAEITHLAVAPDHRHMGLARSMVEAVQRGRPAITTWRAETDGEAVGFYRATGFEVDDLGERYPGVRRYRCTRRADPAPRL